MAAGRGRRTFACTGWRARFTTAAVTTNAATPARSQIRSGVIKAGNLELRRISIWSFYGNEGFKATLFHPKMPFSVQKSSVFSASIYKYLSYSVTFVPIFLSPPASISPFHRSK